MITKESILGNLTWVRFLRRFVLINNAASKRGKFEMLEKTSWVQFEGESKCVIELSNVL